ncbi:DUF4340 domain-containing protein [Maricaulis sp.]|uniref:DUF4340 domain-containing protein n=1 Tax=Maricaulis sp. TaxID=1486257 RepID=UPI002604B854|nr:DUF4340 domain-containing protein [Maricaulis sp.]
MSQPIDKQRTHHILIVGGLALAALVAALSVSLLDARRVWQPELEGAVFAAWPDQAPRAQDIEVAHGEARFSISRQGERWVMPSRDNYPVRPDIVAAIDAVLSGLTYAGARTADPAKYPALALAEPGEAGGGARLTVRDASGAVIADLIAGETRGQTLYIRLPGEARSFAADLADGTSAAALTQTADQWLDLGFLELGRTAIARVRIQPETGPAYRLERPARSTRNFALREPAGWTPITAGAGNGPASALGRIRFRDVRQVERLTGAIVGSHTAETFGGLEVTLDIIAQGETRWARIRTNALTDDAAEAAALLQEESEGWAYLLSDLALDRLLRPLDEIADPRPGAGDAP